MFPVRALEYINRGNRSVMCLVPRAYRCIEQQTRGEQVELTCTQQATGSEYLLNGERQNYDQYMSDSLLYYTAHAFWSPSFTFCVLSTLDSALIALDDQQGNLCNLYFPRAYT